MTCAPVRPARYCIPDTENRNYGTVVIYKCLDMYTFADKTNTKSISCLKNGNWSAVIDGCARMLSPLINRYYINNNTPHNMKTH